MQLAAQAHGQKKVCDCGDPVRRTGGLLFIGSNIKGSHSKGMVLGSQILN